MNESAKATSEINPYQASPVDAPISRVGSLFTWTLIGRLLAVVFLCTLAGGVLGISTGVFLGLFFPEYYEQIFGAPGVRLASPMAVGVGLGLSQGLGGGAAVGVAISAIGVWYVTRMHRQSK